MRILHKNLRDMEIQHQFGITKIDINGEAEVDSQTAEYLIKAGFELLPDKDIPISKVKDKLANNKASKKN